jgi:hypothetical protein
MKKREVVVNLGLLMVAVMFAYLSAYQFGELSSLLGGSNGSFLDMTYLIGLPEAYLMAVVFLFVAFGKGNKKAWVTILLIPAVLINILDPLHIYIPIIIGLVGWGLGWGIDKGLKTIKK